MKPLLLISASSILIAVAVVTAGDPYREAKEIHAKTERELNAAYELLIARIKREQPDRAETIIVQLRKSQRAWLAFRDEQASFVGTYHDVGSASGRAAGVEAYERDLTRQRIKDFEEVPDPF